MRDRLEQSADWLAPVPSSAPELVEQLGSGPGRLTPSVPLGQDGEGLFILEREASRQPAADAEGVNVTVLSRNRGRHRRQIPPRAIDYAQIDGTHFSRANEWLERSGADGWEVLRFEPPVNMAVLNRDEVRLLAFMIHETRQTRRLGDRSRGRVRVQFARELLL